jgi:uncharacterized Ntn-hydrolase superfamily protein
MTFSVAGRCARTGNFGIAVVSSSPAVAARCAHARAGAGAAATQNITDPRLGPALLDFMASGMGASQALNEVRRGAAHIEFRQLTAIDANGATAAYSGERTLGIHTAYQGTDVVTAGNLLSQQSIPQLMAVAFESQPQALLGDRLLLALRAALAAGGEAGPVHSAGMLIVADVAWPVADLRVDWHETDPIAELNALWERWKPQLNDYVQRALNPSVAPSFGVPGAP